MKHPVYQCRRVSRPLKLTGRVDDPLWATAEVAHLYDAVTGEPKQYRSTAHLLYDEQYLYIAFKLEDHFVWGTYTEHDSPIWTEECVEVFISPSAKMRQYYEINVSPRNTVYDAFVLNGSPEEGQRNMLSFPDYTCAGMITSVHIDGMLGTPGASGWSAEYAIPFSSLIGSDNLVPVPGEAWRLNLYRIDSLERNKLDLYSWAEMGKRDFHLPWQFGTLRFV